MIVALYLGFILLLQTAEPVSTSHVSMINHVPNVPDCKNERNFRKTSIYEFSYMSLTAF